MSICFHDDAVYYSITICSVCQVLFTYFNILVATPLNAECFLYLSGSAILVCIALNDKEPQSYDCGSLSFF
jgi:hypothetical protein